MNELFERRFVERSRKIASAFAVASMTSTSASAFAASVFAKSSISIASMISKNKREIQSMHMKKNDEFIDTSDEKNEVNEFTAKSTIQTRVKLAFLIKSSRMIQQFLHVAIFKRKRDITDEKKRDEHRSKIARAMMTLLIENFDTCEHDE